MTSPTVRNRLRQSKRPQNEEGISEPEKDKGGMFGKILNWRYFMMVVGATSPIYSIQIFFAILTLIGFAALGGTSTDWLFSAADFVTFGSVTNAAGAIFWLGAIGAFICGCVTYAISMPIYSFAGLDGMRGINPIILVICLIGLLCPIINFFPLVWVWCLYMVMNDSQS